jgi:hypothetical protein
MLQKLPVYWQDVSDKGIVFFGYVHFMIWNTFPWKNLFHNEHAVCQFNTLSTVKTHSPFTACFVNTRFPCCVFFTSPFFSLSLPVYQALLLLPVLSWNNAFHTLHVIINDILSVCLVNFLFSVSGHCKNSWRSETYLSLSLLSVPVSMAALVQVSPRVRGVISTLSTSNVCFSLFLIYILGSVLLHGLPPEVQLLAYQPQTVGTDSCPKTSVRNYHYSLHNNRENHSFHLLMFLIMHK